MSRPFGYNMLDNLIERTGGPRSDIYAEQASSLLRMLLIRPCSPCTVVISTPGSLVMDQNFGGWGIFEREEKLDRGLTIPLFPLGPPANLVLIN